MRSFADDLRAARSAGYEEMRVLRRSGATRRGLSDDFYRLVAQSYRDLIEKREPYPVKALATRAAVDNSTASRWISSAQTRGFLS